MHTEEARVRLLLTGRRKKRRYLSILGADEVWLTPSQYSILLRLVLDRLAEGARSGIELTSVEAFRIRKEFELAIGFPGSCVVELVGDSYYRLATEIEEVRWETSFMTLELEGLVPPSRWSYFIS